MKQKSGLQTEQPAEWLRDVMADWQWAFHSRQAGQLDQYRGRYVAVLDAQVTGEADDPVHLRQFVAAHEGVDPERIVVLYVDETDESERLVR